MLAVRLQQKSGAVGQQRLRWVVLAWQGGLVLSPVAAALIEPSLRIVDGNRSPILACAAGLQMQLRLLDDH